MSSVMGQAALGLVEEGFDQGQDPYGRAWAPLKDRDGIPLTYTGKLRSSYKVHSNSHGFVLESDYKVARFHQTGYRVRRGRTMGKYSRNSMVPARKQIPEGSLPPQWEAEINAAADEYLRAYFGF